MRWSFLSQWFIGVTGMVAATAEDPKLDLKRRAFSDVIYIKWRFGPFIVERGIYPINTYLTS